MRPLSALGLALLWGLSQGGAAGAADQPERATARKKAPPSEASAMLEPRSRRRPSEVLSGDDMTEASKIEIETPPEPHVSRRRSRTARAEAARAEAARAEAARSASLDPPEPRRPRSEPPRAPDAPADDSGKGQRQRGEGAHPFTCGALARHPLAVGAQAAVTGYILRVARCLPCQPAAPCKPCRDEYILVGDDPDAQQGILMLRTSHAQQTPLARGQRRAFTVRFEPESAGPESDPIRRGLSLTTVGPPLPRPRPN